MSLLPSKRPRASGTTGASDYDMICGLALGLGRQHAELFKADSGLTLRSGPISIAVPSELAKRCQAIQEAPTGKVFDDASLFSFWLLREWRALVQSDGPSADLEGHDGLPGDEASEPFEMMKACDFLKDEVGLTAYTAAVHARLVASPVAVSITTSELVQYSAARCPLPLQLLAELPDELARRVVGLNPLPILDRLPLDSPAARLACEACNEWALRRCRSSHYDDSELVRNWNVQLPLQWAQDKAGAWAWRSELAARAGVQIRVRASQADWSNSLSRAFRGLRVTEVHHRQSSGQAAHPFELPSDVESLRCSLESCTELELPESLRSITMPVSELCQPVPRGARLPFACLQLPAHLAHLSLSVQTVDLSGFTLPASITSLNLRLEGDHDGRDTGFDLKTLRQASGLQELSVYAPNISADALSHVQLPHQLRVLIWRSILAFEAVFERVQLPASLEVLNVRTLKSRSSTRARLTSSQSVAGGSGSVGSEECAARSGVTLPPALRRLALNLTFTPESTLPEVQALAALTKLEVRGKGTSGATELALPPGLRELCMHDLALGDSRWLRKVPLPSKLTSLDLCSVQFGSETLQAVPWPPELRRLSISGAEMGELVLVPDTLPDSLESLGIAHARIRLQGVAQPTSLQSLRLRCIVFAGDNGLADVAWAPKLQSLQIYDGSFGSASDLQHLCLPRSTTSLGLQSLHIARDDSSRLELPAGLKELDLGQSRFGEGGMRCLAWPSGVTKLCMSGVKLGPRKFSGVALPNSVRALVLQCDAEDSGGPDSTPQWPDALDVLVLLTPHKDALDAICRQLGKLPCLQVLMIVGCEVESSAVEGWLGSDCKGKVVLESHVWRSDQDFLDICERHRWVCR